MLYLELPVFYFRMFVSDAAYSRGVVSFYISITTIAASFLDACLINSESCSPFSFIFPSAYLFPSSSVSFVTVLVLHGVRHLLSPSSRDGRL